MRYHIIIILGQITTLSYIFNTRHISLSKYFILVKKTYKDLMKG